MIKNQLLINKLNLKLNKQHQFQLFNKKIFKIYKIMFKIKIKIKKEINDIKIDDL